MKTILTSVVAICIALSTLIISGCSSVTTAASSEWDDKVVFENKSGTNRLVLIDIVDLKERRVNDLLQALVIVENNSSFEVHFQYQFRFYDQDGFPVGAESLPWKPVVIQGMETKSFTGLAANPRASSVKVYIQVTD